MYKYLQYEGGDTLFVKDIQKLSYYISEILLCTFVISKFLSEYLFTLCNDFA